ncbi:hypothetical protein WG915_07410 [Corynebacterium sp. H128]|uniref:hypothetical protein n=1 Tax=Corynebacterium sp. H128 TaxID=3133427 RepID=UPI0030A60A1E
MLEVALILVTSSRQVSELDILRRHGEFSSRRIDDFPQIATALFGFTLPGKTIAGPGSMDIVFTRWWDFRLKEGKIIPTDQGYVLEPGYRAQLIDELREALARQRLGFFKDYITKFHDQRTH